MKKYKVVGYMPAWKAKKISKIRYDIVTHVIYSFAHPDIQTLDLMIPNLDSATSLIVVAHRNDTKVLLSIGGWDDIGYSHKTHMINAIKTDENIERFTDNIVDAVYDLDFDGVDINWGNLGGDREYEEQITKFNKILRAKLKADEKLFTVSVFGNKTDEGDIVSYEMASCSKEALTYVDWVNIISYETRDGVRATNTNLKINEPFKVAIKVPKEKTIMGIPFFVNMSLTAYQTDIKENRKTARIEGDIVNCGTEVYSLAYDEFLSNVEWAKFNALGLNVWELTQDFDDAEKSLLTHIKKTLYGTIDELA